MITENQRTAFGFSGTNNVWTEVINVIQQSQETLWMQAISSQVKGEDRVHACGQADGVNMILSLLITLRQDAKRINGLTSEEDLA
jgi:hypothetical protein